MAVPMAIRMAVPMATQRIEVITGRASRRRYGEEEKLRLVEAAFATGVRTAEFARRSQVDQSLLYRWRRQFFGEQPRVPAFTPISVLPEPGAGPGPAPAQRVQPTAEGLVEVELACGARVRVTGAADPAVVAAALTALRGVS